MGRKEHCSEETRQRIVKFRNKGETYQFIQNLLNSSAKMIANAKRYRRKSETRRCKRKTTGDSLIVQNIKKIHSCQLLEYKAN